MMEQEQSRWLPVGTALAIALGVVATSTAPELTKLLAMALASAALLLVVRVPPHPATVLVVAPMALSAVFALEPAAAWLGSIERAEGLLAALGMATFLLLGAAQSGAARQRLYGGLIGLGAAASLYALLQRAGIDPIEWQHASRPAATFSNALGLAGFLTMTLPLTALLWIRQRRSWWLGAMAVQLAGLLATGTRGAWLAVAAAAALTLVWVNAPRRWRNAALVGVVILGVLAATLRLESLHDRLELWQRAAQAVTGDQALVDLQSEADRHHAWRSLVGFGPDQVSAPLQQVANIAPRDAAQDLRADRAHQWLLDRWLATGAFGFLAAILLVAWVAVALLRHARHSDRAEALALGAALGAYAFHLQLAFATMRDRALAYLLIGCALGTAAIPRSVSIARGCGVVLTLLVAASLLPAWRESLAPRWAAQRAFDAGQAAYLRALSETESAAALRESQGQFEHAIALSRYDIDAALAAASAAVELALADGDRAALERAIDLERAVTRIRPGERRLRALRDRIWQAQQASVSDRQSARAADT